MRGEKNAANHQNRDIDYIFKLGLHLLFPDQGQYERIDPWCTLPCQILPRSVYTMADAARKIAEKPRDLPDL